jgi:hypothetical protein
MSADVPEPPRKEAPDVHPGLQGGFLHWLGRQIGYVRGAIKTNVSTVYRKEQTAEQPHPEDPRLKLRRTVIDEIVVDEKKAKP